MLACRRILTEHPGHAVVRFPNSDEFRYVEWDSEVTLPAGVLMEIVPESTSVYPFPFRPSLSVLRDERINAVIGSAGFIFKSSEDLVVRPCDLVYNELEDYRKVLMMGGYKPISSSPRPFLYSATSTRDSL